MHSAKSNLSSTREVTQSTTGPRNDRIVSMSRSGYKRVGRMTMFSAGEVYWAWQRVMILDIVIMVVSAPGLKAEMVTSILFTNGKMVGSDSKMWSNRSAALEWNVVRRVWNRRGLATVAKAEQHRIHADRAALSLRRKSMM